MAGGDAFGFVGKHIEPQVRVDAPLGEGGFSVVYRGRHLGLNEDVAIKFMKLPSGLGPSLTQQMVERFRSESQISYRLSQGNLDIVRSISSGAAVTGFGSLVPYIVLEFLTGTSLAEDFKARRQAGMGGRPLADVIALLDPAVRALEYAHKQGVVHRDVKPGNLFLAETRGGERRLKVLDFGLAKVLLPDNLGLVASQTLAQSALCSPAYGAPEQFDPKRLGPVDPSTDVYGLTMVMLEALAGKKARAADSMMDGARLALDPRSRPSARTMGLDLPVKLEALFDRCVAINRGDRPRNAGEFWSELKNYAEPRARPAGLAAQAATVAMVGAPTRIGAPVGTSGTVIMEARPHPAAVVPPAPPTWRPIEPTDPPATAAVDTDPMPYSSAPTVAGTIASAGVSPVASLPLAPSPLPPPPALAVSPGPGTLISPTYPPAPPAPPAAPAPAFAPAPPLAPAPLVRPRPSAPPRASFSPRAPSQNPPAPSTSRVAAAGAIAFFITLLVLLSVGAGAYRIWLSRHPSPQTSPP